MDIELFPLDKVMIDGKAVCLGMERTAVEAVIGAGKRIKSRNYYFGSEMAVYYDSDERVEFIEFLGGIDGKLHPVIYGVSAFDMSADELIGLLTEKNNGGINDSERGYSYGFINIGVGVYRESIPSDVEDMIKDAEDEGEPLDDDEIAEEYRKADHWATIGIGAADYYRK